MLKKKAHLLFEILEIYWDSYGTYGAPRIAAALNQKGISVSVKKVSKEMNFLGISSIHSSHFPKKASHMSDSEKALIQNLILELDISRPNQVWTTDITYIHTVYDGNLYLISFIDQFSKKVVGWVLSKRQRAEDVEQAFLLAYKKNEKQVFH